MDFNMTESNFESFAAGSDSFSSDQLTTGSADAKGQKRRGGPGGGGSRGGGSRGGGSRGGGSRGGGSRGGGPRGGAPVVPGQVPGQGPKGEVLKDFESLGGKAEDAGIIEKVIQIKRVTKVTKGGKKMSFTALVVVGDSKGRVGFNLAKGAEVSLAIKKAMNTARKNMVQVNLKGSTIPHEIIGECGASRVLLKPAAKGTGVIAAGPVRAICDGAGIHDILSKCHRSNNPVNVIKATFDGLSRLKKTIPAPAAEEPTVESPKG